MDGIWSSYTGIPIIVTEKRKQKRTHKKKRINKKWAKRYGFIENNYTYIENDKAIMFKGQIYMNEKTLFEIKNDIILSSSIAKDIIDNAKNIKY